MANIDNIPNELRALPQWVVHRQKCPYNPRTGNYAKAGQPDTWSDFNTAIQAKGYDGIGFEFRSENGLTGIDLDTVRDPKNGWVDPVALDIIKRADSYTEVSPSGYGFHIICRGSPSLAWHKKPLPPNRIERVADGKRKTPEIEIYTEKRYFTVTGNVYQGRRTVSDAAEFVRELQERYGGLRDCARDCDAGTKTAGGALADNEIIERINRSKHMPLWNGDLSGYKSQSEADIALCNVLAFWCNRDTVQMDRLFRQSGLMRNKWDRKQSNSTYGALTIGKAARECQNVYTPGYIKRKAPASEAGDNQKGSAPDIFKPVAAFEEQEPEWLVEGWIPKGQITLLASDGGVGKTSVVCNIAASKSCGKACILEKPDTACGPARVLLLTTEDSISKKLRKKLRLSGGDLNNIIAPDPKLDQDNSLRGLKFGSPMLEQVIRKYKPDLCIFDPIQGYVPPDINMGFRNAMRGCMSTLIDLGEETGCTFLVVCHSNKRRGASGRERISDSSDLWDIARSVIMAGFTGDENDTRYLSNEKNNYAKQQDTVLFTINDNSLPEFAGYSQKHDRDYVQESYAAREEEPLNTDLIDALKDEANPFEAAKFSYESFEEKYGASIWHGKQPKRALDAVKPTLEREGYSLLTKKVKVAGRNERGFTIQMKVDENRIRGLASL